MIIKCILYVAYSQTDRQKDRNNDKKKNKTNRNEMK